MGAAFGKRKKRDEVKDLEWKRNKCKTIYSKQYRIPCNYSCQDDSSQTINNRWKRKKVSHKIKPNKTKICRIEKPSTDTNELYFSDSSGESYSFQLTNESESLSSESYAPKSSKRLCKSMRRKQSCRTTPSCKNYRRRRCRPRIRRVWPYETRHYGAEHWESEGCEVDRWRTEPCEAKYWRTEPCKAKHWRTDPCKAKHWRTEPCEAKHWRTDPCEAKHWRTDPCEAKHWRTEPCEAKHWRTEPCEAQHCKVEHCKAERCCFKHCNASCLGGHCVATPCVRLCPFRPMCHYHPIKFLGPYCARHTFPLRVPLCIPPPPNVSKDRVSDDSDSSDSLCGRCGGRIPKRRRSYPGCPPYYPPPYYPYYPPPPPPAPPWIPPRRPRCVSYNGSSYTSGVYSDPFSFCSL